MSNNPLRLSFLCSLLVALPLHTSAAEWSYSGHGAPEHWAMLDPSGAYATCSKGQQQSPVDIEQTSFKKNSVTASSLQVNYLRSPLSVVNNGHSIQADVLGGSTLKFSGKAYKLLQFHFHTPSEHQYNGKNFPMEMHWVNQAEDGSLLVLGLMIEQGQNNVELSRLWNIMLPQKTGEQIDISQDQAPDISKILPSASKHVFYEGSLTTPPCSEGVQWVIYEQPAQMSQAQIEAFQAIFSDNHRPLAPLNNRELDED